MRTWVSFYRRGAVLLALAVVAVARPAAATEPRSHDLDNVEPSFLAVELGGSLAFTGMVLLTSPPPTAQCRWCSSNPFDEAVRDLLVADNPRAPAGLSHALSIATAPALALGALVPPALAAGDAAEAVENVVITADAAVLTFGITFATKRSVARERPAVHHHTIEATEYGHPHEDEWNQSFFSGDTSLAFAVVSSATTLSYLRGYKAAPYVLALGGVIGIGTACLRIAADMHWATDVLTGAAVGTAVGFGLPFFVHARRDAGGERSLVVLPRVGRDELAVVAGGTF